MELIDEKVPLIVISGETASGKTSLAMALARRFNGEIICADSRTIYQDMDIGTAKPTARERAEIPHYLLDVTTPDKPWTVVQFKEAACAAIGTIHKKGHIPILVGGTGLYIDAVVFNFSFRPQGNPEERDRLASLDVAALQEQLVKRHIPLPSNSRNPRHLIRQLESGGHLHQRAAMHPDTLCLCLQPDRSTAEARIARRVGKMFDLGLEDEVRLLVRKYGWECRALASIGYQEFRPYFDNQISLEEVKLAIIRRTLQYSKRQRSWFKRNSYQFYPSGIEEAVDLTTTFLNKGYIA